MKGIGQSSLRVFSDKGNILKIIQESYKILASIKNSFKNF